MVNKLRREILKIGGMTLIAGFLGFGPGCSAQRSSTDVGELPIVRQYDVSGVDVSDLTRTGRTSIVRTGRTSTLRIGDSHFVFNPNGVYHHSLENLVDDPQYSPIQIGGSRNFQARTTKQGFLDMYSLDDNNVYLDRFNLLEKSISRSSVSLEGRDKIKAARIEDWMRPEQFHFDGVELVDLLPRLKYTDFLNQGPMIGVHNGKVYAIGGRARVIEISKYDYANGTLDGNFYRYRSDRIEITPEGNIVDGKLYLPRQTKSFTNPLKLLVFDLDSEDSNKPKINVDGVLTYRLGQQFLYIVKKGQVPVYDRPTLDHVRTISYRGRSAIIEELGSDTFLVKSFNEPGEYPEDYVFRIDVANNRVYSGKVSRANTPVSTSTSPVPSNVHIMFGRYKDGTGTFYTIDTSKLK